WQVISTAGTTVSAALSPASQRRQSRHTAQIRKHATSATTRHMARRDRARRRATMNGWGGCWS
ncbi:MAG: hypothetical protein AVDCRST_MAG71-2308, partial [uncultured Lysobacter sp.]